jgi:hypothetical protein
LCFGIKGALHRRYGVLKRGGLLPKRAYAVAKYLRRDKPQPRFLIRRGPKTKSRYWHDKNGCEQPVDFAKVKIRLGLIVPKEEGKEGGG